MNRKYYFVSVSFVVFLDFQVKQILLDFIRDCGEARFKQVPELHISESCNKLETNTQILDL
jgi:hypothetical protein